jgi:peptidoglycan/LPS O-acetylase OafA/YrhL
MLGKVCKLLRLRRVQPAVEDIDGDSRAGVVSVDSPENATMTETTTNPTSQRPIHIAGIDGLRAVAIIAVVAYHTRPSLLKGGFLGVTLFFVISGFLVTSSVERRLSSQHGFHYVSYLLNKLKRLVVPLLALLALLAPAVWAFSPGLLPKLHLDALPASLFAINWVYIFRRLSYFASAGLPSPLTHIWFLSLIMQFYVVWPLLLWLMRRCRLGLKARTGVTLALAVLSTALMMLLSGFGVDVTRAYYGLDTRWAELMIGAIAAMYAEGRRQLLDCANSGMTNAGTVSAPHIGGVPVSRAVFECCDVKDRSGVRSILAGVLLAALFVLCYVIGGSTRWLYMGGYQLVALVTALLLLLTMRPVGPVARLLASRPLRYLGSRSFSLYLVHYPLLEIMNPAIRTSPLKPWEWVVQFMVLWAVTELFYRVAEAIPKRKFKSAKVPGQLRVSAILLAFIGFVVVMVMTVAPVNWNAVSQSRYNKVCEDYLSMERTLDRTGRMHQDLSKMGVNRKRVPRPALNLPPRLVPKAAKVPKNLDTTGWTYDMYGAVSNADPLIISDSVEMGAQALVQDTFPHAVQDNLVGRPFGAGLNLYNQYRAQGHGERVAIIALGTNGPIAGEDQVEQIVAASNGKPIYFTTVRGPVDWQDANNAILRSVAAKHPNVGLLDWYSVSEGHSEYFYADGTHLTPGEGGGREAYMLMIRRALCGQ